MKTYLEGIECTRYVEEIESCTTSGDLDYPGTALEITEKNGNELFHIVVDSKGRQHVLFYSQPKDYRLSLELLEKIIMVAKEKVHKVD